MLHKILKKKGKICMDLYLYKIGSSVPVLTIENVVSYTDNEIRTADGSAYSPLAEDCELSSLPDCSEALREKWRAGQMVQLTAEPPLEAICPEIVNMVLESVEVHDSGLLHFRFLDGTELEIDREEE